MRLKRHRMPYGWLALLAVLVVACNEPIPTPSSTYALLDPDTEVKDGFVTTFDFQITEPSDGEDDGFAFVIRSTDVTVAVVFDTDREVCRIDPDANHISVHWIGRESDWDVHYACIGSVKAPVSLWDGDVHTVKIEYSPGTMKVYLDDLSRSILEVPLHIAATITPFGGKAWVGFAASSNGPIIENHDILDILSWSFSPVIIP